MKKLLESDGDQGGQIQLKARTREVDVFDHVLESTCCQVTLQIKIKKHQTRHCPSDMTYGLNLT